MIEQREIPVTVEMLRAAVPKPLQLVIDDAVQMVRTLSPNEGKFTAQPYIIRHVQAVTMSVIEIIQDEVIRHNHAQPVHELKVLADFSEVAVAVAKDDDLYRSQEGKLIGLGLVLDAVEIVKEHFLTHNTADYVEYYAKSITFSVLTILLMAKVNTGE